jgi:hypothetical protein
LYTLAYYSTRIPDEERRWTPDNWVSCHSGPPPRLPRWPPSTTGTVAEALPSLSCRYRQSQPNSAIPFPSAHLPTTMDLSAKGRS